MCTSLNPRTHLDSTLGPQMSGWLLAFSTNVMTRGLLTGERISCYRTPRWRR